MKDLIKALTMLRDTADLTFAEAISHLDHAIQTYGALQNQSIEMRTAGFWHDIGHSYVLSDPSVMLSPTGEILGMNDHDQLGKNLLKDVLPERATELISMHTAAKRYRGNTGNLSHASSDSLKCEGGEFTSEEKRAFESHPLFSEALVLRDADDFGKKPREHYGSADLKLLLSAIIDTLNCTLTEEPSACVEGKK